MKFTLVANALTALAVTSTSAAHDFTPEAILAAIGLDEAQGDDDFVNSPCYSKLEEAHKCGVDAGVDHYACAGCNDSLLGA